MKNILFMTFFYNFSNIFKCLYEIFDTFNNISWIFDDFYSIYLENLANFRYLLRQSLKFFESKQTSIHLIKFLKFKK